MPPIQPVQPSHARSRRRRAFRGLAVLAIAGGVAAAPASASAEIVSKLSGPEGLPFQAEFIDASSDGRYVLMVTGNYSTYAPPATGPEADPLTLARYVVRDRVADTLTPLEIRLTPDGAPIDVRPEQISDDGNRVLFSSSIEAVREFVGTDGVNASAVYDRSEERAIRLPSTPGSVYYGSTAIQLSADGTEAAVLARVQPSPASEAAIYRGPIGGVGVPVVAFTGMVGFWASKDLDTIAYRRILPAVQRPIGEYGRLNGFQSWILGVKQGAAAPRIVHEPTRVEEPIPDAPVCRGETGIKTTETSTALRVSVAPDGRRMAWSEPSAYNQLWTLYGPGAATETSITGGGTSLTAFGLSNQLFETPIAPSESWSRELVKNDTELIEHVSQPPATDGTPRATRYTVARPYDGTTVTTPRAPMDLSGKPIDTAGRQSQATWYSCPPPQPVGPIGEFEDYVEGYVTQPGNTNTPLGRFIVTTDPQGLRPASRVSVDATIFGLPYAKREATARAEIILPKAPWGLPVNIRVTVQPATTPGETRPAPIVRSWSVYTFQPMRWRWGW